MFTKADQEILKSMGIKDEGEPVPELHVESHKEDDMPDEMLVAKILHKILNSPSSVPVEALEELGKKVDIHNILHGLNDYGMIFYNRKKQGFYTNPAERPVVLDIIHRNGLE